MKGNSGAYSLVIVLLLALHSKHDCHYVCSSVLAIVVSLDHVVNDDSHVKDDLFELKSLRVDTDPKSEPSTTLAERGP